jgi:hypothetical protein
MSKWLMRSHFGHLHFKTFPMTVRTVECKEIFPLQSSSEFLRVSKDSNFPLLGVWASPSHLAQSGGVTPVVHKKQKYFGRLGNFLQQVCIFWIYVSSLISCWGKVCTFDMNMVIMFCKCASLQGILLLGQLKD